RAPRAPSHEARRRPSEAGQAALKAADRLADAVLVLDEREPHELVAPRAEPDARGDGDVALLDEVRRELDRAHVAVGLGDASPREHGAAGLVDVPADALQAVVQGVAARL